MRKNLASLWKSFLEVMFPELRTMRLDRALVVEDQRLTELFMELSEAPMGYQEQELSPQ